jgi:hypothetical protein
LLYNQAVSVLDFGQDDLIYGPSAKGKLRAWRRRFGGKLLDEATKPEKDGFGSDWESRSIDAMEKCVANQNKVRFDLTNVDDMEGVLNNTGSYAGAITSKELRFIRDNWGRFESHIIFYKNNEEVKAPWLN